MKPTVLVIAGPTASGKTSLGVQVAKALDGEVISADSMQVYRGMPIATAQPTVEEMQGVPHHLIGFVPPEEPFSVAKYQHLALSCTADVLARGKVPVFVGGTGLYLDAVLYNTHFVDCAPTEHRDSLRQRMKVQGSAALLEELRRIDPETAAQLHVNDEKRLLRALELYYATGMTMTRQREQSHTDESPYAFCKFLLTARNRQFLYDRINRRVDVMLQQGLLDEARAFFAAPNAATAKQAIGYKELKPYLDGEAALDDAVERLKMETRRYAKRQLTWFRRYDDLHTLYIDELSPDEMLREVVATYQLFTGESNETFS